MSLVRARRAFALLLLLALPVWAWALDFGFKPPRDPDDVAAVDVMRDLAKRIVPVYQDTATDAYLANVTALQIVSGTYGAAFDSSKLLRGRYKGKPFDALAERAILDGLYANARAIEAKARVEFPKAYARSFQELVQPLDNTQAAAVMARLAIPPSEFREPVRQAFDRWRAPGSVPQAEAVDLVRSWLAYESRRSFASLLPELFAAENRRRYVVSTVGIPVRGGVIHAGVVRPGAVKEALPTLLRFTLDPAEDDAQRSALKGYVGVTAYVRGRAPDGKGAAWPFVRDGEDAAAVIDWIARQPWSDGRVAMVGDGYSGYAAWAAARRKPAALKAIATIAPMAPGIDFPMAGQIYRNTMVRWAQEHATAGSSPTDADAREDAREDAQWNALDARWYRGDQPYWDIDRVLIGKRSKLIRTWLTHPSHDRYWQKFLPSAKQFEQLDIPVLTIGGYYGAEAGALYYHQEHRRNRAQADSTLLLGPYDAKSIKLGTAATLRGYTIDPVARVDLPELRYQWLTHVLRGGPKPALLQDRVNYQVMGADQWRHVPALDAPDRTPLRLYLDTGKRDGPHRLLPSAPDARGSVRLSVDLADRRDVNTPWPDALRLKQLPARNSIVFASDPLAKDTEIEGSLRGEFDITPSRQDVDLVVSLYEQTAGGDYQLLFEPYDFRASYAGHRVNRRLLRAGERQPLVFTAERVTARKLAAGSSLVLVIGLNKRPDRQINYGSGKDVNSETIEDAGPPVRVRWHAGSHVEIQTGKP